MKTEISVWSGYTHFLPVSMGPLLNVLTPACYTCPVLSFSYPRTDDKSQKSLLSTALYVLVRVLQRNKTKSLDIDIWKEIYYEELAHIVMKAEKPRDLPSASWRPRKAGGVVSVQTQRPGNQRSQWCKSQSESEGPGTRSTNVCGQKRTDVSAQAESKFSCPPPFSSIQTLSGLDDAHLHW